MPTYAQTTEEKTYIEFVREPGAVINKYSVENLSDTPDFLLAQFMAGCLKVYENTVRYKRERYGGWSKLE